MNTIAFDRLTMPKLVVWGEHDGIFPLEWAEELYQRLPEPKRLVPIANCGTFPHEELPGAWLGAVRSFLK